MWARGCRVPNTNQTPTKQQRNQSNPTHNSTPAQHLYPELGVELPEKAYGEDCRLRVGGAWNWPVIGGAIDEFVVAHALGWWGKALILRDNLILWTISVGFELMEMTFQHWLPNFNECWWDHWILDVAVCNWAGLAAGVRGGARRSAAAGRA